MAFRKGRIVVYSPHGLGKIVEKGKDVEVGIDIEDQYYVIEFDTQNLRLSLPVNSEESERVREPISKKQIKKVKRELYKRARISQKTEWRTRVEICEERLEEGDPLSLAAIVRDLGRLSLKKKLNYQERKLLKTAMRIMCEEIAFRENKSYEEVEEEIEDIIYR